MTRLPYPIALACVLAGCAPNLDNQGDGTLPEPEPSGEEGSVGAASGTCWTIAEDFWSGGWVVYELNTSSAQATMASSLLSEDLWLDPSIAILDDVLYAIDSLEELLVGVNLITGATSLANLPGFDDALGLGVVGLEGGLARVVRDPQQARFDRVEPGSGAVEVLFTLPAGPSIYAAFGGDLLGLQGSTLSLWDLASLQLTEELDLDEFNALPDGMTVVGEEVVVIALDEIHRFDRRTGARMSAPTPIQSSGDAWAFRGLSCVP